MLTQTEKLVDQLENVGLILWLLHIFESKVNTGQPDHVWLEAKGQDSGLEMGQRKRLSSAELAILLGFGQLIKHLLVILEVLEQLLLDKVDRRDWTMHKQVEAKRLAKLHFEIPDPVESIFVILLSSAF